MSTMEQALRDEIEAAYREGLRDGVDVGHPMARHPGDTVLWERSDTRARLAALTAALPAPGVEAGDRYQRHADIAAGLLGVPTAKRGVAWHIEADGVLKCFAAAPSAPAEITQAQAQAMREALLFYGGHDPDNSDHGEWVERMNEDGGDVARAALPPEPPR